MSDIPSPSSGGGSSHSHILDSVVSSLLYHTLWLALLYLLNLCQQFLVFAEFQALIFNSLLDAFTWMSYRNHGLKVIDPEFIIIFNKFVTLSLSICFFLKEFTERTHKRRPDKPELRRGAQDTCGFRASDLHGQPFKKLPLDDSFTATSSTHVFLLRFRFLSKMNWLVFLWSCATPDFNPCGWKPTRIRQNRLSAVTRRRGRTSKEQKKDFIKIVLILLI